MQQDVLGLDVAVDDAVAVGVVERRGGLGGDAHRVGHGQLLLAADPVADGLALDERHDVIEEAVGVARVDESQDVRVLQVGGGLDLGQEAFGADDGAEFGAQDLDRDLAVVLDVLGQVHGGHAARAEFALESVAIGERVDELRGNHGHVRVLPGGARRRLEFGEWEPHRVSFELREGKGPDWRSRVRAARFPSCCPARP